jgi:hypothetical protein
MESKLKRTKLTNDDDDTNLFNLLPNETILQILFSSRFSYKHICIISMVCKRFNQFLRDSTVLERLAVRNSHLTSAEKIIKYLEVTLERNGIVRNYSRLFYWKDNDPLDIFTIEFTCGQVYNNRETRGLKISSSNSFIACYKSFDLTRIWGRNGTVKDKFPQEVTACLGRLSSLLKEKGIHVATHAVDTLSGNKFYTIDPSTLNRERYKLEDESFFVLNNE